MYAKRISRLYRGPNQKVRTPLPLPAKVLLAAALVLFGVLHLWGVAMIDSARGPAHPTHTLAAD